MWHLDEEGVFLEVEPFQREVQESSESEATPQKLPAAEQKGADLQLEFDQIWELLAMETAQLS